MAEPKDVQAALRKSLKKFYIIATAILVAIVLGIVFKDSMGRLFKGFLIVDLDELILPEPQYSVTIEIDETEFKNGTLKITLSPDLSDETVGSFYEIEGDSWRFYIDDIKILNIDKQTVSKINLTEMEAKSLDEKIYYLIPKEGVTIEKKLLEPGDYEINIRFFIIDEKNDAASDPDNWVSGEFVIPQYTPVIEEEITTEEPSPVREEEPSEAREEEPSEEKALKAVQGSVAEETEKAELVLLDEGETIPLGDFEDFPPPEDELPAPDDDLPLEDDLPPDEEETVDEEPDLPAPDEDETIDEDDNLSTPEPEPEPEITIISVDTDPKSFNPLYEETKITYELSEDAQVEISIHDDKGVKILTLLDNKNKDEGENSIWWNGTNKKDNTGTVVDSGIYTYKIIAKDPNTSEPKDTKSGTVKAFYLEAVDFEEIIEDDTPPSLVAATTQTQDSAATITMQITPPETTSDTGPETIIYLLFPVAGYLLSRKKLK